MAYGVKAFFARPDDLSESNPWTPHDGKTKSPFTSCPLTTCALWHKCACVCACIHRINVIITEDRIIIIWDLLMLMVLLMIIFINQWHA